MLVLVLHQVTLLGEDGMAMGMKGKMAHLHQKKELELPLENVLEPLLKPLVVLPLLLN